MLKIVRGVPGTCQAPGRRDRESLVIEISGTPEAAHGTYCFTITHTTCGWIAHLPATAWRQPYVTVDDLDYAIKSHLGRRWRIEL